MNKRPVFIIACAALLLFFVFPQTSISGTQENFGINWQFSVELPQSGISGILKGRIEHLRNKDFKFTGSYVSHKSPIKSGPAAIETQLSLGDGYIKLRNLSVKVKKLDIDLTALQLSDPDISITGNGTIRLDAGTAIFNGLTIKAGSLPAIIADLSYSPHEKGTATIKISNPLPVFEVLAESFLPGFNKWDKRGDFELMLKMKNIKTSPESELKLNFKKVATASPDGAILVDSLSGAVHTSFPAKTNELKAQISLSSGEALFDTFYINLNEHPLHAMLFSTVPDSKGRISTKINAHWKGMGELDGTGTLENIYDRLSYRGKINLKTTELGTPFKALVAEPFSLTDISATGQLNLSSSYESSVSGTLLTGIINYTNGNFNSDFLNISGINSKLPFSVMLDKQFKPRRDENMPRPDPGVIQINKVQAGPVKINKFYFPLTVSSNSVEFGEIPTINLEGGTIKLSELRIKNPFSEDFALHGILDADNINLLPLSPASLPVNGKIGGDIEFWLLKEHLSTSGKFYGEVYGGNMTISEIYAEDMFTDARQYGADFHVKHLDLEPLSKALDIGRITGSMDLDLTDLVIAYDQPASFKLRAVTTPDSDSSRDISLKAVNTLSVIGTGSGLTGAGVGMFSQFFKEFGYAGLGLECTLDNDLFKIRGLIREDKVEYIIKRPTFFGINVINSNPENRISFADMLKRLKRVIGN
ncbi:hypothetical protein [Maridesulfovibrio hydrothermalis]|uniref:AsmA-like C-terminal domain-containing protein n=1 Tax=Maridesulfovibrio hydrothermalis AM13 = DSM 14728 TaxID=1121451 RepID=L0RDV5_9BACT|nr:hypothetical protein [Maridesulfovibrio hydrothermalis]CCO23761.1 conserved exported protein of unknown function [Maridesulfovibrio hydrothermalis AM13 = DSM 14728]